MLATTIAKTFNEVLIERGMRHAAAGDVERAQICLDVSKKAQERERRKGKRRKPHTLTGKEKKRQLAVARKDPEHSLAKGPAGRLEDIAILFAKDFTGRDNTYAEAVVMAAEVEPETAEQYVQELSKSNAALTLDGEVDFAEKERIEKFVQSRVAKSATVEEIDDAMSPELYARYQEASGFAPVDWE